MFSSTGSQTSLPAQWQPPNPQHPPHGAAYPPPQQQTHPQAHGAHPPPQHHMNGSLPPPNPREPRPDMDPHRAAPYPPQYAQPPPQEWHHPPPEHYRGQAAPTPNYIPNSHTPSAPRQRTAIACRYCRRRKIRCSGFENTDDGRCGNCIRFNQDCIFTPVSAQTQAFVPAHTIWRGVGAPPPMYGAYGQPLPPSGHAPGGPQTAQQQPPPPPPGNGYPAQPPPQQSYLPSPTTATGSYFRPPTPPQAALAGESQEGGHRRGRRHRFQPYPTPTPPPQPVASPLHVPRTEAGVGPVRHSPSSLSYPSPPSPRPYPELPLTSSATSAPSHAYPSAAPPPNQPYYASQPPRRTSPHGSYDSRASQSPNARPEATTPNGSGPYYAAPPQSATLQPVPPRNDGRTPPPPQATTPSGRTSMRITDLVDGPQRDPTDSSMLSRLNGGHRR